MFYSQFILAKKGPLGTIWIAAHLERKLRKNQVADTDIGVSVDSILFPEMPIALRLSSHLLLGVVRIYSRKVNYLFDDCSEALLKVKQAFRSTAVDLPPEESTAPYHSITLPETFDLDDFELPDNETYQGNYVDHHISSKDQITLQDTMEGVVYSTSKFGLDERFGDGDASGLDLDEELLVEKAATAEHATGSSNTDFDPQASAQANASLKYEDDRDAPTVPEAMPASGIENQQVGEYDGDNEPVEYAQAPCTPGLWEEPNLSNIQETSACDDHHEPENHSLTDAVKENLENASSKEAECLPHEQHHNHFEPHGEPLPNIASTEQMLMDDLGTTPFTDSLLADQARSTSPIAKAHDAVNAVSDDPIKAEDLLDKNARDDEPGVQAVNDNHENCVELQGMLNYVITSCQLSEGNQENTCHLTTELEPNTEPSGKDNLVSPQDHTFLDPNDSMISVQSPHYTMPSSDFPSIRPCTTPLNHSETSDKKLADTLQPTDLTSLFSIETSGREEHPSASGDSILVQGEGPHATEASERNLPEVHLAKPGPNDEFQVASNISNKQMDNVIEGEFQVDTINSYSSDFPAPEKLLSLPQVLSDLPKDFVPESTPAEKEIATGDGGDAGSNMLAGKKRSFTESSLTAHSLNLDESSGLFATNVTRESVLDDDDLLSSILGMRLLSFVKLLSLCVA
ncbi:Rad21/Rec8-like protein, N-terminal, partial [Cynara cardunculus var. scolymus]